MKIPLYEAVRGVEDFNTISCIILYT